MVHTRFCSLSEVEWMSLCTACLSSPRPNMADNTESTIEQGGTEETVGLMVPDITEDEGANGTTDITPSNGRLQYMVELL